MTWLPTSPALPPSVVDLWPMPARARLGFAARADQTGYWVVPSVGRPRLLLPMGVPGAARMLERHGGSRAARAAGAGWRRVHRSRLGARLPIRRLCVSPAADGIEAYLSEALSREVSIGVLLGPPRANLKPVLQIFDTSGTTIAFAKLGLTPLTSALLDTEASALALLGERTTHSFTAPQLLHHGRWQGNPIVVQAALRLSQSGRAPQGAPPREVIAEIAAVTGVEDRHLGDSDFLAGVRPADGPDWFGIDLSALSRLHDVLQKVDDTPFGAWHGDFGPWNMATDGDQVEVWDWERFETGVPVGMDAAHYRTQVGVAAGQPPGAAWAELTSDVSTLLVTMGLDARRAGQIAASYLLAIFARYRRDVHDQPTDALRRRVGWLTATAAVAVPLIEETRA